MILLYSCIQEPLMLVSFLHSACIADVFRPIADLAERYNVLQAAMAAGERIFDILDREREDYQHGERIDSIQSIEFDNVWFAYQEDHWILRAYLSQ